MAENCGYLGSFSDPPSCCFLHNHQSTGWDFTHGWSPKSKQLRVSKMVNKTGVEKPTRLQFTTWARFGESDCLALMFLRARLAKCWVFCGSAKSSWPPVINRGNRSSPVWKFSSWDESHLINGEFSSY